MPESPAVLYWDSSAILSVLFKDGHSRKAKGFADRDTLHLITTLAYAEVNSVTFRMRREHLLTEVLSQSALEVLERGPWRRVSVSPEWQDIHKLAATHPLRGADLWHLAAAVTLKRDFPELMVLTFDQHLKAAAKMVGLAQDFP